jgi:hypothetical protein
MICHVQRSGVRLAACAVVLVVAISAALLSISSPALASGGVTIDNAPTVVINTTVYGNLATDPLDSAKVTTANMVFGEEWWKVPVIVGDTIDITVSSSDSFDDVFFWPGVTDTTVLNAPNVNWNFSDLTARATTSGYAVFGVGGSGLYTEGPTGPFEFEIAVTHHATVSVPKALIAVARRPSVLRAIFRYVDGSPVTNSGLKVRLQGRWSQPSYASPTWHTLAKVVPSHGLAPLTFTPTSAMAGKTIDLRVEASGASFAAIDSSLIKLTVAR